MTESATNVQKALIASLAKLEKSDYLTAAELQWLHGSVMRLIAEFAVLQETKPAVEHSAPHAA